eukprot:Pgem_evm1s726
MLTPLYNISQQASHKGASILGPLLFLIFINDLALQLEQTTNVPTSHKGASILGPLLFLIFINDLALQLEQTTNVPTIGLFADDLTDFGTLPKTNYLLITGADK